MKFLSSHNFHLIIVGLLTILGIVNDIAQAHSQELETLKLENEIIIEENNSYLSKNYSTTFLKKNDSNRLNFTESNLKLDDINNIFKGEEGQKLETIKTDDWAITEQPKVADSFLRDRVGGFTAASWLEPTIQNLSQAHQHSPETSNPEDWPEPIHDNQTFWLLQFDQLEYRANDGENIFNWDVQSWVGGDYERIWFKTEGDIGLETGDGEAEIQVLYGKLVHPFWDLQIGLRYDQLYGDEGGNGRAFGVIGIEGLAPYFFEIDAALFISHEGDISVRFEAEYELLLSQKLILQPEFETNIALQQVEDFGVGSGLNDIELSLRLRYEFSRQFAPYVGISWTKKFGDTADFAREEGDSTDNFAIVGGLKLLF